MRDVDWKKDTIEYKKKRFDRQIKNLEFEAPVSKNSNDTNKITSIEQRIYSVVVLNLRNPCNKWNE